MKTDSETMTTALDYHNKLQFDQDGETFTKATSISDNAMVALPTYYNPVPGVTMIQSDPIHGSLGEPKIKMEDFLRLLLVPQEPSGTNQGSPQSSSAAAERPGRSLKRCTIL